MLHIQPLPAFNDNYIWKLSHDEQVGAYVVDPGDAQVVLDALTATNTPLLGILITHHHYDHTDGVARLVETYDVPVYGPKESPFAGITHPLSSGDTLSVFDATFTVQTVPGHTLDHIAYFTQDTSAPVVFSGDTLFLAGCGRLFEGSPAQMLEAMDWFKSLPDHTKVYCTHEYSLANLAFAAAVEPNNAAVKTALQRCKALREQDQPTLPTSIAQEKTINPFMRADQPDVQDAASGYTSAPCTTQLEAFTAVREWKNNF